MLRVLLCLFLAASARAAPPLRLTGQATMVPLIQAVYGNQGLVKHLYSFTLAGGPQQFLGLTGNVSFTAMADHFGEALISVAYLNGGDCAAVNGLTFNSYTDPGFPPLTHLASFTLKTPRAGTVALPVTVGFAAGVPVSPCLVLVLDGGGAWGPGHAQGMDVTVTSFLTFLTAPLPAPPPAPGIAYPLGGEFIAAPAPNGNAPLQAAILRTNPAAATRYAVGAIYGSVAASPFDGTSGEPVPTGAWRTRSDIFVYPSAACAAGFAPPAFGGALHASRGTVPAAAPPGGRLLITQHPAAQGGAPAQSTFSQYYAGLTLAPGDCVVTLLGPVGATNGTLDLEQQATVVVQPLP